jgi:hypothetical protein
MCNSLSLSYYLPEPGCECTGFCADFTMLSLLVSTLSVNEIVCWFKTNFHMLSEAWFYYHYLKIVYK